MTAPDDSAVVVGGRTKVLDAAAEEDGQTMTEILDRVSLSQPYVSTTLSKLADEGLLRKEDSSLGDGRKKQYTITEQGQEFLDVLYGIYGEA